MKTQLKYTNLSGYTIPLIENFEKQKMHLMIGILKYKKKVFLNIKKGILKYK